MSETRITTEDGAEIAIYIDGSGPDLMLVSGLSGNASYWDPIVGDLAKRFRVIRIDQRGVGKSTSGSEQTTVTGLAEDCLQVLDAVGAQRALLVGHSTGGVILQSMALTDDSQIAGLVLSGTWAKPNKYMSELFRSRSEILKAVPKEYTAMVAFLGAPADWLNSNWPYYQAMVDAAPVTSAQQAIVSERIEAIMAFDRSGEIGKIRVPMLIQGAEDDLIVPAFLQRELHTLLPKAELSMMMSGGHFFPTTRPSAFTASILAFADKIGLTQ
jgi:aminoacrylate hydrolase